MNSRFVGTSGKILLTAALALLLAEPRNHPERHLRERERDAQIDDLPAVLADPDPDLPAAARRFILNVEAETWAASHSS